MEYDLPVAQMARGDDIEGFYVLKSAFSKVANNGKPFLNLTLSDRTGAVDAKVWDYPGPIGAADEGKVVKIRGSVSEFRGALQVTVERIRLAGEDDRYDVTALVPTGRPSTGRRCTPRSKRCSTPSRTPIIRRSAVSCCAATARASAPSLPPRASTTAFCMAF